MSWKPYTYYLYHVPTGKKYYGVKFGKDADPSKFWTKYFSSSKEVKALREEYGDDSFIPEIRRTFNTAEAACKWEVKVLRKLKAGEREDWLNNKFDNGRPCVMTPIIREQISLSNKGKVFSEEHKRKLREASKGRKPSELNIVKRIEGCSGQYRIRFRDGSVKEITNLKLFCAEHDYSYSTLTKMSRKEYNSKSHFVVEITKIGEKKHGLVE